MQVANRAKHVLITGGTGFIGVALANRLAAAGHVITTISRSHSSKLNEKVRQITNVDLGNQSINLPDLEKVDVLIHLAGAVVGQPDLPMEDCVNVMAAKHAIEIAHTGEIKNIIVVSTIYARMAEEGYPHARRYGHEKLAADQIFLKDENLEKFNMVFFRPPAVYGESMKGRLADLAKLIRLRIPLPLGMAKSPRIYISIDNLVDLLVSAALSPANRFANAKGKIFEVSDGVAVPTNELAKMIGNAVGRKPVLLPVPLAFLRMLGRLSGKLDLIAGTIDPVVARTTPSVSDFFKWEPKEQMPESLQFLDKSTAKSMALNSAKRLTDLLISIPLIIVSIPIIAASAVAIRMNSSGPAIFSQVRVGHQRREFTLYKLRTMRTGTGDLPSHLAGVQTVTPIGKFLRKTKLDELPQLFNVIKGEMSLVGPRPCLPTQKELILARTRTGAFEVRPGITGPAQIAGVDMSTPEKLAEIDGEYASQSSLWHDLQLLFLTLFKGRGDAAEKSDNNRS